MKMLVHVAVGVVEDEHGQILIARRPSHLHQGGLWEFPGGKVEEGEDVISALRRELREEVGIEVSQTQPLISIEHDYGDKLVLLDVHRVTTFLGNAHGREGQSVQWITLEQLGNFKFPAANRAIINAIRLPEHYMITAEATNDANYLRCIHVAMQQGVRLIQLRAKHLSDKEYLSLAKHVVALQMDNVTVLLNTTPEIFAQTSAAGLHLSSQKLMQYKRRPIADDKLLSASVHNEQELRRANLINADLLLASPVKATVSHPQEAGMGWERFGELVTRATCPVYALGGMTAEDITVAKRYGAQGIAGIRLFEESSWCNKLQKS